jgi:hypothetical protein
MRYGLPCHILTTKGFTMISFNTPNRAYLITSHGNGWAYEITDQQTGHSLWFQDDDASRLQEESQDFELETVLDQYFECMGE